MYVDVMICSDFFVAGKESSHTQQQEADELCSYTKRERELHGGGDETGTVKRRWR